MSRELAYLGVSVLRKPPAFLLRKGLKADTMQWFRYSARNDRLECIFFKIEQNFGRTLWIAIRTMTALQNSHRHSEHMEAQQERRYGASYVDVGTFPLRRKVLSDWFWICFGKDLDIGEDYEYPGAGELILTYLITACLSDKVGAELIQVLYNTDFFPAQNMASERFTVRAAKDASDINEASSLISRIYPISLNIYGQHVRRVLEGKEGLLLVAAPIEGFDARGERLSIVGFLVASDHTVVSLGVEMEFRRHGIGSLLLSTFHARLLRNLDKEHIKSTVAVPDLPRYQDCHIFLTSPKVGYTYDYIVPDHTGSPADEKRGIGFDIYEYTKVLRVPQGSKVH